MPNKKAAQVRAPLLAGNSSSTAKVQCWHVPHVMQAELGFATQLHACALWSAVLITEYVVLTAAFDQAMKNAC
jgi:hypothetical protein